MARRLDNSVGSMGFDNLIIEAGNVGTITVRANSGVLKRGTLLTENTPEHTETVTEGGETSTVTVPAGAGIATGGAGDAAYVLTDDIDTEKETVATVYKTGKFIKESLIADGDINETDIKALRTLGILVESATHVPA